MTKFDMLRDENEERLLSNDRLEKIYDIESVHSWIENFAQMVQLTPEDINLVINYKETDEMRNEFEDLLVLKLLDRAVKGIEAYFQIQKIIKIIDQTKEIKKTILLKSLDTDLSGFKLANFRSITDDEFESDAIYDEHDELISGKDEQTTSIEKVLYSYGQKYGNPFGFKSNFLEY